MKQKRITQKIMLMLLCLIGINSLKSQVVGTTSVNPIMVTAGTTLITNQSPDANQKWYKFTPTQPNIAIRFTKFDILIYESMDDLAKCVATPIGCNTIKNPSFENNTANCANLGITLPNSIPPVCEWGVPANCNLPFTHTAVGTPDYFHSCAPASNYIASGFSFTTIPHTGSANVGIFTLGNSSLGTAGNGEYREYINSQLTTPLIPGKVYQFSLWTKALNIGLFSGRLSGFLSNSFPCQPGVNQINTATLTGQQVVLSVPSMTNLIWKQYIVTFTANAAYDKLTIGNFELNANSNGQINSNSTVLTGLQYCAYYHIDDVAIKSQTISVNSPIIACNGQTAQINPTVCELEATTYSYVWSPSTGLNNANILAPVASPTITTTYTVTQTGTSASGTVINTAVVTVSVSTSHNYTLSANPVVICSNIGQTSSTLTANSGTNTINFLWQPGSGSGNTFIVTPTSTTIYTATGTSNGCSITQTIMITVQASCCTQSITNFVGSSFPTNTVGTLYTSPLIFNNDVTIPAGSVVNLSNTEFLFAPNVKINVSTGATLILRTAHLYACGTSMWQGIVVNDGGKVVSTKENLIEDAIVAMDVSANTTSTVTPWILQVTNTVFNKNYISIKIDGFQRNSTSYPFSIFGNVFTSRNFTFTPSGWPYANLTVLRSATNPTTGLATPYLLQSAAIVNLKAPYTNQSARIGLQVNNSGITSGSNYYSVEVGSVGGTQPHDDFNLFDALLFGVDATNSNVSSINNVYQNSQRVYFCPKCHYEGGTAIVTTVNTNLNAKLNMTTSGTYSASYGVGNRFWDCHKAVDATNVYRLDCNYATFRSTQTTTAATSTLLERGAYGIIYATNRFENNIRYNKFNNINNAIAITVAPGTYTYGAGTYSGILANNILIDYNYFGAQLTNATAIGTAFLNNAVYLGSTSNAGWNSIAGLGLRVANNEVNRAWRGIYVDAFGYPSNIITNTVTLLNDATIAATQRGISANGNISAVTIIANNKLTGVNTTNTLVTLVYVGASPVSGITCNTLNTSYQGFEFNSSSNSSTWKGNDMSNHARGMALITNGSIGTQGTSGAPSDNRWWGSWTGFNGTYVDGTSNATNSILWVQNSGVFVPPTPGGPFASQSYATFSNTPYTTGTYVCGSIPPPSMMMSPSTSSSPSMLSANATNASAEEQYVADNTTYRYLDANPSVKNSNTAYINFYNAKANSSMDKFKQVEASLYNGQIAQAQSINNSVSAVNLVEDNYKNYYTVFTKYKNGNFTSADSATLINLAKLCPGMDGSIVYQARALYNLIYKTVKVYKEDCNTASSNGSRLKNDVSNNETLKNNWNVELFPNPTKGNFTLVSKVESEVLTVTITDITGKLIYSNTVNTSNFIINLDVN